MSHKVLNSITATDLEDMSKDDLISTLISQRDTIAKLQANISSLQYLLFSKKSERCKSEPEGMACLFDEPESIANESQEDSDIEKNETVPVNSHKRKPAKRKPLPASLPRERIEHDLDESEKICKKHGCDLERIGESKSEKLEIIPAQVKVIEHVTFSYKCPCCINEISDPLDDNSSIISSSKEPSLISKSYASSSLLAYVATAKYCDALPLYRQEKIFARYGIDIKRNTLSKWMIKSYEKSIPLLNLLYETFLKSRVIGVDETILQVLKEAHRKAEQQSFMWTGVTMCGPPVVIYKYNSRRSAQAAKNFTEGFEGVVVCDGLKSYDSYAATAPITLAACMAHVRRYFFRADRSLKKASPKTQRKTEVALNFIKELYKIEDQCKGLTPEKILQTRQDESKPIMEAFKKWLDDESIKVRPTSQMGKAISYALGQWDKLQVFLSNPWVQIDNNKTERAIRPFVIGRKNWLFADTPKGADASAGIYTLIESAKANNLEPFSYLNLIFKELGKASSLEHYERLLPFNVKKYFDVATLTTTNN